MKSLRLEPVLETRLKQAAEVAGVTESELMRAAVGEKVDAILGTRPEQRLLAVIGRVHGGGGRARDAHRRFGELLARKREK
ncbi:MAG: hypothetical protein ACYDGR_04870 [Candidatus Dormibacteria bacterium]